VQHHIVLTAVGTDWIVEAAADGATLRIPPALVRPIAGDDVAQALRDPVLGRAQNRELEIVRLERFRLDELAPQILAENEIRGRSSRTQKRFISAQCCVTTP
jgi:hypothetical protein